MKILCVIDSLGSGGAQRQLVNLAIEFQNAGHSVSFLVYHSDPFYYPTLEAHDIDVIEVLESNYFRRLLKMRRVIRSGKFDSVLSFLQAANFISEISGLPYRKWRLVVGERSANPAILKSWRLKTFRLFHLFADVIVANSKSNLTLVRKVNPLLPTKKLHVIYNLIDFDKWRFRPDNYEFRKGGVFNLVVVASHQFLKNLNGLVEAVNLLTAYQKSQLVISWYGSGSSDVSKNEALKKIAAYQLTENFKFYVATVEIADKVNEADALGLFSFYEGLPNVVCEAMANSKPVILSAVSDMPLLIDDDLVFDPYNYEEIAGKLTHLLNMDENLLRAVGDRNKSVAMNNFNLE
ncbi:MAG: glycosyltransferase, partial [Staphylococcus equorum]|nr:glycosyltransferase [Staphylococcus equorum]